MSVLERCPSYKESNKGNKQRQGPTLGVRFTEVSVKRESTVYAYGYVFYGLTPTLMSKNVNIDVTTNPYTLGMSLNSAVGRPDTLVNDYEDKLFLNWTLNFKGSNNGM